MADDLTFLMGKLPGGVVGGVDYARNHVWARPEGDAWRFGFTAYAIRLMQDVYFLDWHVSPGDELTLLQEIGHIETSKAVSDLFAPLAGALVRFNPAVLDDPSAINVDGYGAGWLYDLRCAGETLMTAAEYHRFLAEGWEKTQQLIKGKINAEDA